MTGNAWATTRCTDSGDALTEDAFGALQDKFDAAMNECRARADGQFRERIERSYRELLRSVRCLGACRYFVKGRARFVLGHIVPERGYETQPRGPCLCHDCVAWRTDLREAVTAQQEKREPRWALHEQLMGFR